MDIRPFSWTSPTARRSGGAAADAYERLLLDAMVGDPTLFIRSDEVDTAWGVVQPLLRRLGSGRRPPLGLRLGVLGPRPAETLIERDGRQVAHAMSPAGLDGAVARAGRPGRHGPEPGRRPARPSQYWQQANVASARSSPPCPNCAVRRRGGGAGTRTAVMTLVMVTGADDDPEDSHLVPLPGRPPPLPGGGAAARPRQHAGHRRQGLPVAGRPPGPRATRCSSRRCTCASVARPPPTWPPSWARSCWPTCPWSCGSPSQLPDPADPLLRLASAVVVDTRSHRPRARGHRPRLPDLAGAGQPPTGSGPFLGPPATVAGAPGRPVRARAQP